MNMSPATLLRDPTVLAGLFFAILLASNVVQDPIILSPRFLTGMLGVAVPLVIGAMAVTPSILSGGGGIDLSIGPLMGLVNVLVVTALLPAGLGDWWIAIPLLLAVGVLVGAVNGWLVAALRLQPIVATLGTYLVLGGLSIWLLPTPLGPVPPWFGASRDKSTAFQDRCLFWPSRRLSGSCSGARHSARRCWRWVAMTGWPFRSASMSCACASWLMRSAVCLPALAALR